MTSTEISAPTFDPALRCVEFADFSVGTLTTGCVVG
jgi:hypothetical protein